MKTMEKWTLNEKKERSLFFFFFSTWKSTEVCISKEPTLIRFSPTSRWPQGTKTHHAPTAIAMTYLPRWTFKWQIHPKTFKRKRKRKDRCRLADTALRPPFPTSPVILANFFSENGSLKAFGKRSKEPPVVVITSILQKCGDNDTTKSPRMHRNSRNLYHILNYIYTLVNS